MELTLLFLQGTWARAQFEMTWKSLHIAEKGRRTSANLFVVLSHLLNLLRLDNKQMGMMPFKLKWWLLDTKETGQTIHMLNNWLILASGTNVPQDPRFMTQEDKDRGLGSVCKRDDQWLLQLREKDAQEEDPNFIFESYAECYPGEYNHEVIDSDDEDDLSKMDMDGWITRFQVLI